MRREELIQRTRRLPYGLSSWLPRCLGTSLEMFLADKFSNQPRLSEPITVKLWGLRPNGSSSL